MGINWERHAPPGLPVRRERRWFVGGLAASALYSLSFLFAFFQSRYDLYFYRGTEKILREDALMPDFADLLGGSLNGFLILAVASVAAIAYHYAYHFQGSRSIYLMRRLPRRLELHRRCLTLPLLAAAVSLLAALLLLLVYYLIYMALTPGAALAPGQWQKLWSVLL